MIRSIVPALAFIAFVSACTKGPAVLAQVEGLRATAVTIHRIDPASEDSKQGKGLAAWKVLDSKVVDPAKDRQRILDLLLGDKTYGDRGALCFDPRDAITLKNAEGKPIDLVICFECSWVYFYDGEKHLGTLSFSEKGQGDLAALLHEILPRPPAK